MVVELKSKKRLPPMLPNSILSKEEETPRKEVKSCKDFKVWIQRFEYTQS